MPWETCSHPRGIKKSGISTWVLLLLVRDTVCESDGCADTLS